MFLLALLAVVLGTQPRRAAVEIAPRAAPAALKRRTLAEDSGPR
jgi:hypothetical protein